MQVIEFIAEFLIYSILGLSAFVSVGWIVISIHEGCLTRLYKKIFKRKKLVDNGYKLSEENIAKIKTKKWEEFKNMSKKEMRNVGFEMNVIVPVDVKTNLASIDVDELVNLYKKYGVSEAYSRYWKDECLEMKRKNDSLMNDNKLLNEELEVKKEENEKLKSKIISLQFLANSVYGLPKPCNCNYVLCCGRHHGESAANAFAKAAESLANHIKAGKPTYDQLLKENEKLRKECELKQEDINKLTNLLNNYRKEVDDLTLEIDVLRVNHKNHSEHLNKVIEEKNKKLNACSDYENTLKEEYKTLTKELEAYRKQCSRLEHGKINAWASAHDNLNNANEKINKLETENIKLKQDYQKLSDEVKNINDSDSYYKLWKDLADEYCKLEDKYNKVYVGCQKYKKYCEEFVKCIEPTGTGCCLNKD